MSEIHMSMRVLWVTGDGKIRANNMNNSRSIPEWAGKKILQVNLLGPIQARQFIAFTMFQFAAIQLDADGRQIREDGPHIVYEIGGLLSDSATSSLMPYPLPNEVQQEALYEYIKKRWPTAMASPQSKLAWYQAIRSVPDTRYSRLRWVPQPFRDD